MRRHTHSRAPRYGTDALSATLAFLACVLLVIALIIGGTGTVSSILWVLALIFLVLSYLRIFSRNYEKRQAENDRFLQLVHPITAFFARQKTKHRQKNLYCFFKCPQCATVLRVPKGKGHVRITCRSCQHVFERNT